MTVMRLVEVDVTTLTVLQDDVLETSVSETTLPNVVGTLLPDSIGSVKTPVPVGPKKPSVSLPTGKGLPVPVGRTLRVREPVPWNLRC